MRHRIAIIFILASLCVSTGCRRHSTAANNSNDVANGETAPTDQYDNITDPNEALAEGNRMLDENQTDAAIAAFRRAIQLDPDLADAHFQLGISYSLQEMQDIQQGQDIDATKDAKGEPAKTRSDKEFELAAEAYKKWIEANPKDDTAEYNLGRTYAKLNRDEDAEKAFRAAVKLKPDDSQYQTELGAVLMKLAKYHEAVDALKKALDLDSDNVHAEELLDDAKAGAQRLDYSAQKSNLNAVSNRPSQANSNANSATSSNTPATNVPADRQRVVSNKATPQPTHKPAPPTNHP